MITIFLSCSYVMHYSSECVHHRVNNTKKPNQICFLDSFMGFDAIRHHFPSGFTSGEILLKIPLVEEQTSRLTENGHWQWLIFRQTDILVQRHPLWLMEFLMESTIFLQERGIRYKSVNLYSRLFLWLKESERTFTVLKDQKNVTIFLDMALSWK